MVRSIPKENPTFTILKDTRIVNKFLYKNLPNLQITRLSTNFPILKNMYPMKKTPVCIAIIQLMFCMKYGK